MKSPHRTEYQYHLKDHLGNVRTTFTTKEEQEETTATLETEYENTERSQYVKYDDTRRVLDILFDHTNGVKPSVTPGYSLRLNGSPNERNGIARSISVMPGDKIDMQVFGKYIDPNTPHPDQTAWNALMAFATAVANAAQQVVIDGVGYTSGTLRLPPYSGVLTDPNESTSFPKAHLNWVIFDRDNKFVDGGAKQLQGGAENGTDVSFAEINASIDIKEPGYVYIWLSNTNAQLRDVYFDDFKVTHTKSPVVASESFYPFGLSFDSYTRENSVPNQYKYNGKELQDELNLGWMDYGARMYDRELGRWWVIDPLVEKMRRWSPYSYAFNNPIVFIDIDGNIPWPKVFGNNRTAKIGSSPFGMRMHPIRKVMKMHDGIDLGASEGTPMHSLARGKVSKVGYSESAGNYVEIDHADGYQTRYLHIRDNGVLVKEGDEIDNGQLIAEVGSTGGSTSPHLHLGMKKDGKYIDPESINDLDKTLHPDAESSEEGDNADYKNSSPEWARNKVGAFVYFLFTGNDSGLPDETNDRLNGRTKTPGYHLNAGDPRMYNRFDKNGEEKNENQRLH